MAVDKRADALDLVYWYSNQAHHCTTLSDRDIAIALGWTFTRRADIKNKSKRECGVILGDTSRVQRARRYVDTGRDDMFSGYSFGTRENGGGISLSRMKCPDDSSVRDESGRARHIAAQLGRLAQSISQHTAEIARDTMLFRELLEEMKSNNDPIDRIMAISNAIRDLETFGRIQTISHWEMVKSGIPMRLGEEAA